MKMELPSPVLHSLFSLNRAGYEAFVVGGCVRDALRGIQPFDWDITTSASPDETAAVFREYTTIKTGIQHGTITVIIEDIPLEITTYRVDGDYIDGRHPDSVIYTTSLTEDLRRRDFTINAMAYHPTAGLIDPFGGQEDLKAATIRCVGDPEIRFSEDALRILRGLRFSSVTGFSIDHATGQAIHRLTSTLSRVSIERITAELNKLLCGKNAGSVLREYADVFAAVLPLSLDLVRLSEFVEKLPPEPVVRYGALLFEQTPEQVALFTQTLKFSRRVSENLLMLSIHKQRPISEKERDILTLLHHVGPDLTTTLLLLHGVFDQTDYTSVQKRMELLLSQNACYRTKDLAISGTDLLAYGLNKGPQIGLLLDQLLEAVIQGNCANNKEELIAYMKQNSLC